jgi:hypothetical protein
MRRRLSISALMLAACAPTPQAANTKNVAELPRAPAEAIEIVNAQIPDFIVTNAEPSGELHFVIEGKAEGSAFIVQLANVNAAWGVLAVRREMAWTDVPVAVRSALLDLQNATRDIYTPQRAVEVRNAQDDRVLYEVYDPLAPPDRPILISLVDNHAVVLPRR